MSEDKLYKWNENQNQGIRITEDENGNSNIEISFNVSQENEFSKYGVKDVSVFSRKADLIRNGQYTFKDKHGVERTAKRTSPSWFYMKPLLRKLDILDDLLDSKINLDREDAVQKAFIDATLACEKYLAKRKNPRTDEGKARYQMISDFYDQIKMESWRFSERVKELKKDPRRAEGYYWVDVLRDVRTKVYDDKDENVKIDMTEGATSDVYKISEDGKTKYFKENKDVPSDNVIEIANEKISKLQRNHDNLKGRGANEEQIQKSQNELDIKVKAYKKSAEILNEMFGNDFAEMSELLKECLEKDCEMCFGWFMRKATRALGPKYEQYFKEATADYNAKNEEYYKVLKRHNEILDGYREERTEDEYKIKEKEFFDQHAWELEEKAKIRSNTILGQTLNALKDIRKDILMGDVAKDMAQIEDKQNISKRNVATTRLAELLGIENLVATSELTDVVINGQKKRGIMMEEADGKVIFDHKLQEGQKLVYSGEALKQSFNLQIFDMLCGQVDRHKGNFLTTVEKTIDNNIIEIKNVKAIDNDLSFGLLTYKDIVNAEDGRTQELRSFVNADGTFRIPYIDYHFARKICELEPEILSYKMADILSKSERAALVDRLKGIQKVLRPKIEEVTIGTADEVFFVSQMQWDNAAKKYSQEIAEKRNNAKDENERDEIDNTIKNTTYLVPDILAGK